MFGFDDAMMMALAEEASMSEGVAAATEASSAAEAASAANAAATANELSMAQAAGLGAVGGAGGAGITQAGMASDVLAGGAGAGEAGINAAQVGAQQNAATAIPNSGITEGATRSLAAQPVGITQAPYQMTSADREILNSNIGYQGSELPIPSSTPPSSSFFDGMNLFGLICLP